MTRAALLSLALLAATSSVSAAEPVDGRVCVVTIVREASFGGRTRKTTLAAPALPVDDKGLFLLVGTHQEPSDRDEEATTVTVRLPGGADAAADLLGGDEDLRCTLVRLRDPKKAPAPVALKGAPLKIGDRVNLYSRHGQTLGFASRRLAADVEAAVELPRRLYALAGDVSGWQGSIVATQDHRIVGFLSVVETMPDGNGLFIGIGSVTAVIVPLEAYADLVRDPPTPKATEEPRKEKGWLGVNLAPFDKNRELYFGVKDDWKGALITGVSEGSPSAKAGIKVFDLLQTIGDLEFDFENSTTANWNRLLKAVQRLPLREEMTCRVVRFHEDQPGKFRPEELQLKLTLMPRPLDFDDAPETEVEDLGFKFKPLTQDVLTRLGLPRGYGGVVVTGMTNGLPAALSGLRSSDIVLALDDEPVKGAGSMLRLLDGLRKAKKPRVSFFVRRGTQTRFVFVRTNW
ncbi:MAG: PDZ domain-containing protein [Planctomycetota bacterium]